VTQRQAPTRRLGQQTTTAWSESSFLVMAANNNNNNSSAIIRNDSLQTLGALVASPAETCNPPPGTWRSPGDTQHRGARVIWLSGRKTNTEGFFVGCRPRRRGAAASHHRPFLLAVLDSPNSPAGAFSRLLCLSSRTAASRLRFRRGCLRFCTGGVREAGNGCIL